MANTMKRRMIHDTAIIDSNMSWRNKLKTHIGTGTYIWHFTHICAGVSIGDDCVLGQNVYIGPGVKIGNRVRIQNNVSVYEGVNISDDVFVGPSVVFTNVHMPNASRKAKSFDEIYIEKNVVIGANSTIVAPCVIKEGALVGAGSVVTNDVRKNTTVYGNPARTRKIGNE